MIYVKRRSLAYFKYVERLISEGIKLSDMHDECDRSAWNRA